MGIKGSVNRQRIVDAADHLFYSRGYNQTSFSDISDKTGIPRGNFYYYFKTKEDILTAVVNSRVAIFKKMLEACDNTSTDPRECLHAFAALPIQHEDQILQYGCPIGTLCSELVKDHQQDTSKVKISAVFDVLKVWCCEKFKALGFEQKAQDYSMDLLAKLQGIATLSNIYNDREFLHRATRDVQSWINQLASN